MKRSNRSTLGISYTVLGLCLAAAANPCLAAIQQIPGCAIEQTAETDGIRRLALIVGVGQYISDKVPDLAGPPEDARRMQQILSGKNGYGFPQQNVCMLLDDQATVQNLQEAFDSFLLPRLKEKDIVVFYYAGHGSQTADKNGDEPDGQDETLVLHDSRTEQNGGKIGDFSDDRLNGLLAKLYKKSDNVTVILDSCNSGTATRGDRETMVARFVEPAPDQADAPQTEGVGDGAGDLAPESMPNLIALTAASDGTSALEQAGRGIFTDALLQVLGQGSNQALTYAQAARQIPALVAARSYQIPYFQGKLDRPVFGNSLRTAPVAWEVTELGPPLKLAGPPLPGLGAGAELRIYDGALSGADTRDPAKAKASVAIETMTGLTATANIVGKNAPAAALAVGDIAVPVRPADDYVRINVRIKPESEPGGVPPDRAAAIKQAIADDPDAKTLLNVGDGPGDFELSLTSDGLLQLKGPENRVRNVFGQDSDAAHNLWQHARQKGLLQLRGEGGSEFSDNQSLQIEVIPSSRQDDCAKGVWEAAAPNADQIMPLCHRWNVKVTLDKNAPAPLLVGGVVLSTDGSSFGFPADGRRELLKPGESTTFSAAGETFRAGLPLDVWDQLIVFGTKEKNPVRWDLLTQSARTRAADPAKTGLYRALDRYLTGTRGQALDSDSAEDTTWTLSKIKLRVEANSRFQKPGDRGLAGFSRTREFTIPHFDIRPYLPDDRDTALYKVLQKADWLAQAAAGDGFGYRGHAWNAATDLDNLKRGIDCSRAIWFAFTRAGLPYNAGDKYLNTADMVKTASPLAQHFERCDNAPLQTGDLLVYRDPKRGDGHVVMVVDPLKRIAWGSHGYDGNAKELKVKPDIGVEYQLIKYKKDWERWDRKTMRQKACWRYRQFGEEIRSARGLAGVKALAKACDIKSRCGN